MTTPLDLKALDDFEKEKIAAYLDSCGKAWVHWEPRPDMPEEFDQQSAFVNARDLVSFALGGNGSGKTVAAAKKCSNFLLTTEPPRKDTPFWIIAEDYAQVCSVCWAEKLNGTAPNGGFLPDWEIDYDRIVWFKPTLNWPFMVPLKPWSNGNNWMIEFKSYKQGRAAMQARSVGGFWFSEQVAWPIFLEVLRGCREYMFPGGQFLEFTPIEPELCVAVERIMDNPPPGWGFYRLNTELNKQNLASDWFEQFFAAVPDEMLATRKTGALATFEGVIYQSFNPAVHVVDDDSTVWLPGMSHYRAFDWGASVEHPFAGVWACEDGVGDMLIYDEYWDTSQDRITQDHALEILARSIAWGWPEPDFFDEPSPNQRHYVKTVRQAVAEIVAGMNGSRTKHRDTGYRLYGDSFADPSRPGEINAFNYWGIATSPASNDVYKGIDLVRTRLKVNPISGKPRLYIHRRCKHLIEELRKYRWLKKRQNVLYTTAVPRPIPLKKDDDTADALRYLIASVERMRGLAPASTSSVEHGRHDVLLDRQANERGLPAMAQATAGWFRK